LLINEMILKLVQENAQIVCGGEVVSAGQRAILLDLVARKDWHLFHVP
jgi:hypothetical protein